RGRQVTEGSSADWSVEGFLLSSPAAARAGSRLARGVVMNLADVDVYSPDRYSASVPHAQFHALRAQAPVFRHPHPDGGHYWLLTRHRDVEQVSRDHRQFSSHAGFVLIDDLPPDI